MVITNEVMKIACAALPGLMSRYGKDGYSDDAAIYEAFRLADNFLTNQSSETFESKEPAAQSGEAPVQQVQPVICATYGIYRYKNCRSYIGNHQCGSGGNCPHKQQAVH